MREIKFRARHVKTGLWWYGSSEVGYHGYKHYRVYALPEFWGYIRKGILGAKTVGQYTGLKDKNDKEIYEGDIIGLKLTGGKYVSAVIEWQDKEACFGCKWDTDTAKVRKEVGMPYLPGNLITGGRGNPWEVIGNI